MDRFLPEKQEFLRLASQKTDDFAEYIFRNWIIYYEFCEIHFCDGRISKVPGRWTNMKQLILILYPFSSKPKYI